MISSVYLNGFQQLAIDPPTNNTFELIESISNTLKLSPNEFYLTQNGKRLQISASSESSNELMNNAKIDVHLRLYGGKGGFGSMLRAIGAQIEKTTNREACRDLSGRRLRDINEEKRLKAYLEKQANKGNDEAEKRAKKIAKLRAQPKHEFKDDEYFNARSHLIEDVSDALEEGLKNSASASSSSSTIPSSTTIATTSTSSSCSSSNSSHSNDTATATATATESNMKKETGGVECAIKRKKEIKGKKSKKKLKGAQWIDDALSSSDDDDSSNDDSNDESDEKSK